MDIEVIVQLHVIISQSHADQIKDFLLVSWILVGESLNLVTMTAQFSDFRIAEWETTGKEELAVSSKRIEMCLDVEGSTSDTFECKSTKPLVTNIRLRTAIIKNLLFILINNFKLILFQFSIKSWLLIVCTRYYFFLIPPKKRPTELCKTALTFTEIPVNSLRALNMPAMKSRRRTNYTGSIRPRFIVSGSTFIPCIIQKNIRYDSLLILQKLRPDVDFTT